MSKQKRIDSELKMQAGNDRAKQAARTLMGSVFTDEFPLRLRCECGRPQCDDVVEVPSAMGWESKPMRPVFVIAPEHQQLDIEKVIKRTADFYLVKKDLPGSA